MTPYYSDDWLTVYGGDCLDVMRTMPADSVDCVVTSPPYWGQRDYGHAEQIGLERTPEQYVEVLAETFRAVRRVLKPSGVVWINLGDSYFTRSVRRDNGNRDKMRGFAGDLLPDWSDYAKRGRARYSSGHPTLKDKDLVGIPWRVALALQADGWWLRSEVIWHKTSVTPDGATDRPTPDHEQVFLLTRSGRYWYDAVAIREPAAAATIRDRLGDAERVDRGYPGSPSKVNGRLGASDFRNKRTVWRVSPQPYRGQHTATFPPPLIEPMILAGCPAKGVVLDPFAGSGTVGMVANRLSRRAVLIDLNPEYLKQQMQRNAQTPLGLSEVPA